MIGILRRARQGQVRKMRSPDALSILGLEEGMLWPSPQVLIRPNSFSNVFRRCFASSAISNVYSRATCGRQALHSDVDRKAETTSGRMML